MTTLVNQFYKQIIVKKVNENKNYLVTQVQYFLKTNYYLLDFKLIMIYD